MLPSELRLKEVLDHHVDSFNRKSFITVDPISIPHRYSRKEDIEITGFWTAMFSWGQRKTIINKAHQLFELMGDSPTDFILHHKPRHRKKFEFFVHRTFQYTDTLYFLEFLQTHYQSHPSLESLFLTDSGSLEAGLVQFHERFFSLPNAPQRTRKHVSTPLRRSTCKRLNMFLRWMVRKDALGVDFGIWEQIRPSQLYIPLDVHVERIARQLGLLLRKQRDWQAVIELTGKLRTFDPDDPTKYDFALFGLGVLQKDPLSS
jgi:uncharacterized protein (TIGR02757 family)